MKTYLECIPCFFRQALDAARIAGASQEIQKRILDELGQILPGISLNASPPEMGGIIHELVKKMTKKNDPYKEIKEESNRLALGVYDHLKKKVQESKDPLFTAVELAIAGNIIDYGVKNSLNIHKELQSILNTENQIIKKEKKYFFNFIDFKKTLNDSETILYLADNAGETVFDRILIEEIKALYDGKKIIYAVKGKPIINDALVEDARACGIDQIAEVISSGLDVPGTIIDLCSKGFKEIYIHADMVISKGQGNFEALSEGKRPIFFLFMAKCPVVVEELGCHLRDIILLYHSPKK